MEEDIIELQELCAHQEQDIKRLSDELYVQQEEIGALRKRLELMEKHLENQRDQDSGIRYASEETPPPHY